MDANHQHPSECFVQNNNSSTSEVENVKTGDPNSMYKNVTETDVDKKQNNGNLTNTSSLKLSNNEAQNETQSLSNVEQTLRRTLIHSDCKWEFLGIGKKYVGIYINGETFRIFKTNDTGSFRLSYTYICCGCLSANVSAVFWKDSAGKFTCQVAPSEDKHLEHCKQFTKAEAEDFIHEAQLQSPPGDDENDKEKSDEDITSDEESQIDIIKGYNDVESDGEFESYIDEPVKDDDEVVQDLKLMLKNVKYSEDQISVIKCLIDNAKSMTETKDVSQVPISRNVDHMVLRSKDGYMRKYEAVGGTLSCMFCLTKGKNVRAKLMSDGKIKMPKEEKHNGDCSPYKIVDINRCKFDDNVFSYGGYNFTGSCNRGNVYRCNTCLEHDHITKAVIEKVIKIEDHCNDCTNPRKRVRFNNQVNVQRYKRAKQDD